MSPTINAAVAAAAPVTSTTPLHPPKRKASASRSSDSHSCAVQGAPGIEWLNGSACGATPWAMIHSPVATCDHVSPSPSTWGEKTASVNRKIAIAATPSPACRTSDAPPLAARTNGRANDIAQACRGRNNAALNRRRWPSDARHRMAARSPSVVIVRTARLRRSRRFGLRMRSCCPSRARNRRRRARRN